MWIVRLTDQRMPYGPIADRKTADRFADFLTVEVDPAQVEPLDGPPAERLFDPLREVLDWRDHAKENRPSWRGGTAWSPADEAAYREEQGT